MRKLTWLVALMLFLAMPAMAQTPQVEVFGGFSYLRADVGGADLNQKGWNFSVTENVNDWLGGVADFSGHYGHEAGLNVNDHTFMFGPRFSYRKNSSFTPFAHVLLGGMRASRGYIGISQPATDFAAAFGGGLDVKVHDKIAIRIIQAEYVVTPYFGLRQDNMRLSAGIVLQLWPKKK
jgi:opacity protein-like surface antigen